MKTQEEVGTHLRERLAVYATLATVVTSQAITTLDEAADAVKQSLNGQKVAPVVAVIDGTVRRQPLTALGSFGVFTFDVLIYLFGATEDNSNLDEMRLRTLMGDLEKQVCEFVDTEGGNTDMWNFIEYLGDASSDNVKTLAETLFAAKLIPLQITSYR